jgi:hypothetical protein
MSHTALLEVIYTVYETDREKILNRRGIVKSEKRTRTPQRRCGFILIPGI